MAEVGPEHAAALSKSGMYVKWMEKRQQQDLNARMDAWIATNLRVLPARERKPVTMAMARNFDAQGFHELARITRKYAVDRPGRLRRWLHCH